MNQRGEWQLKKIKKTAVGIVSLGVGFLIGSRVVNAAWTPLIASTDLDPIRTDITTAATGIISVVLIVLGLGILIKVFVR
jgi:hypothetical protein